MTTTWIVSTPFTAVHPDGRRAPLTIRIAAPQAVGPEEWSCAVAVEGLHDTLPPIRGGDALQALALTVRLVGQLLGTFRTHGGVLLDEDGGPVPLEAYFGPGLRADDPGPAP